MVGTQCFINYETVTKSGNCLTTSEKQAYLSPRYPSVSLLNQLEMASQEG